MLTPRVRAVATVPSFASLTIVVICSDPTTRTLVASECMAAGLPVTAVARLADLERWPTGAVVVTDLEHLTPWWRHVGVRHVLALVDSPTSGPDALDGGATCWVVRSNRAHIATALAVLTLE